MQNGAWKSGNGYPKARIMIVSDDQEVAQIYSFWLERASINANLVKLNDQVDKIRMEVMPDMIIVDSYATQGEDIEVCRRLRQGTIIPILLITTQTNESHILKAYEVGVDEVITQPTSPRLFKAKIRAWLRHIQSMPSAVVDDLHVGGFTLNEEHRVLLLPDKRPVRLTYLEAHLLYLLMNHVDQTIDTPTLVERVWGHYGQGESILVKNLVYRLRRKIEPNPSKPRYLLTDENRGYLFSSGQATSHKLVKADPVQEVPNKRS